MTATQSRLSNSMDFLIQNGLLILGVLMCAAVALQFSWWTASSVLARRQAEHEYQCSMQEFDRHLQQLKTAADKARLNSQTGSLAWNGVRKFIVRRLVKEADDITSIYLCPHDSKPLPEFQPGQFLTFHLNIPGQKQSVVRCYTLSDEPRKDYYRCSIKHIRPPADQPDLPPGVSSSFFNDQLREGDTLAAKAPSGGFHLDLSNDKPAVLLAGGIGVTPMISMIKTVAQRQPNRMLVLFYSVANSRSHAFANELDEITSHNKNIKVITCYSRPLADDIAGKDYQVKGHVSAELLAKLLPSPDLEYYLCGPPAFMETLYHGLIEWGAAEQAIHFESFGPASVRKAREISKAASDEDSQADTKQIEFELSGSAANWDRTCDSILELAEQSGIAMDSGCRSGSCGTCVTRILRGQFEHIKEVSSDLGKDECLVCVAKPLGDMVIDA